MGKVERMLKAKDKIIRKQTLESLNPGIPESFLPANLPVEDRLV